MLVGEVNTSLRWKAPILREDSGLLRYALLKARESS